MRSDWSSSRLGRCAGGRDPSQCPLVAVVGRMMLLTGLLGVWVWLSVSDGGWVRVDDPAQRPGPLYVRFSLDENGLRWRPVELHLVGGGQPITGRSVRQLPLATIEAPHRQGGGDPRANRQRASRPLPPHWVPWSPWQDVDHFR